MALAEGALYRPPSDNQWLIPTILASQVQAIQDGVHRRGDNGTGLGVVGEQMELRHQRLVEHADLAIEHQRFRQQGGDS